MALIVGALRVGVWGFTLGTSRRVRALATMGFTIGSTHFTVDHLNGAARQAKAKAKNMNKIHDDG